MTKLAITTVFILLLAPAAGASITHSLVQSAPAGLPPGVSAWDLQVTVSGDDDWTATELNATAFSGSFLNPNPLDSYSPGVNDADTWFAATSGIPSFASGPNITLTSISAVWFDVVNGGSGTFTIARILATSNAEVQVMGSSSTLQGGGQLTTYSFYVPSPGGLAVAAGAAFVVRRRRRR